MKNNPAQAQNPVTWHVTIRKLHKWISEPGEKASRPFVLMITNPEQKSVIKTKIISETPDPGSLLDLISQAVNSPDTGKSPRLRPELIIFDNPNLVDQLRQPLSDQNIRCAYQALPDEANEAIALFEGMIEESAPDFPGLFTVEGLTPQHAQQLFADAETLFLSAPWKTLSDHQPIALHITPPDKQVYVQLMGQAGIQTGMNLFWDWDALLRILEEAIDPIEQIPADGLHSFSFETSNMLPASDLDAVEKFNLPVAAADAYPLPLIYARDFVRRPTLEELALFQAVLQAVPRFVGVLKADQKGEFLTCESDLQLETITGPCSVHLHYPAGEIPADFESEQNDFGKLEILDPGGEYEDDLFDDFRLLEAKTASQALAEFSEDPILQDAQQLVYKAWMVNDSVQRQLLAHQALEISADCADGYILLAEEEAESIEEAHQYYRRGLEAAERNLGSEYVREFAGMFWEKFKTRPLLRALEGMANTLVELEKQQESLEYFKKMIDLDPDDHLGARYGYLHTLIELKKYVEAHSLLHSYTNELSAYWSYTHALISFILNGPTVKAENSLRWALQQNPYVPAYLFGEKPFPETLPNSYGTGDENEAVYYASEYFSSWWQTRGAIDWIKALHS
ncbi:MAG: hypothetical protein A2Z16_13235 [Chloroflexi bacterium RBG_16_54_18]|nr:MAG: hypothetical protein A2Z16_13235 [Chloroflexi bacterium RBG_16_54_18]